MSKHYYCPPLIKSQTSLSHPTPFHPSFIPTHTSTSYSYMHSFILNVYKATLHSWRAESHLNPLNDKLNPICCLPALLGAHHFLHVSRIRVKSLTLRLLMSYIYIYIYDISSLRVKVHLYKQVNAQVAHIYTNVWHFTTHTSFATSVPSSGSSYTKFKTY